MDNREVTKDMSKKANNKEIKRLLRVQHRQYAKAKKASERKQSAARENAIAKSILERQENKSVELLKSHL